MTTLEQIFKTQPYLAIRMMSEFYDDVIDEIKKSHQYDQLFTPTMQNELYRLKLQKIFSQEIFEELSQLQQITRVPWTSIYNILLQPRASIKLILKADNVEEFKIYLFLNPGDEYYIDVLTESPEEYIPVSEKIQLYIIKNALMRYASQYASYLFVLGGSSNVQFIKSILPYIEKNFELSDTYNYLADRDHFITSELFFGAISDANLEVLDYLMDNGLLFNGEDMAQLYNNIYHYYEGRRNIIPHLISRGAAPIDWNFYKDEFPEDYEEEFGEKDDL